METASTTTEDFEEQEIDNICEALDTFANRFVTFNHPQYAEHLLCGLVRVLVANGTLTSKQVKRALKKDEEL